MILLYSSFLGRLPRKLVFPDGTIVPLPLWSGHFCTSAIKPVSAVLFQITEKLCFFQRRVV